MWLIFKKSQKGKDVKQKLVAAALSVALAIAPVSARAEYGFVDYVTANPFNPALTVVSLIYYPPLAILTSISTYLGYSKVKEVEDLKVQKAADEAAATVAAEERIRKAEEKSALDDKVAEEGDANAKLQRAIAYKHEGKNSNAEDWFKKAIKGGSTEAIYELGKYYKEQGKVNDAEKYWNQAAQLGHAAAKGALVALSNERDEAEKRRLTAEKERMEREEQSRIAELNKRQRLENKRIGDTVCQLTSGTKSEDTGVSVYGVRQYKQISGRIKLVADVINVLTDKKIEVRIRGINFSQENIYGENMSRPESLDSMDGYKGGKLERGSIFFDSTYDWDSTTCN